jgi:hypothetical protein
MSPLQLHIVGTVDALGPRYAGDSYRYFGLTLSAGFQSFDGFQPADLALVSPWLWTVTDVAGLLWTPRGDESFVTVKPEIISASSQNLNDDFRKRIEARRDQLAAKSVEENFFWEPEMGSGKVWPTTLARLSGLPFPYAQQLSLSFVVRLRATDVEAANVEGVLVAPLLTIKHPVGDVTLSFDSVTRPTHVNAVDASALAFKWVYAVQSPATLEASAVVSGASPVLPTRGTQSLIDVSTQWVFKPDRTATRKGSSPAIGDRRWRRISPAGLICRRRSWTPRATPSTGLGGWCVPG